jgi:hypothetical protein
LEDRQKVDKNAILQANPGQKCRKISGRSLGQDLWINLLPNLTKNVTVIPQKRYFAGQKFQKKSGRSLGQDLWTNLLPNSTKNVTVIPQKRYFAGQKFRQISGRRV